MSWHGVEGHDEVVEQFRSALARGRLASTFLFVGPPGVGKRTFALTLAQTLLCSARSPELLDPCGRCESCTLCLAGTQPDVHWIAKPAEKSEIPLAEFIGEPGAVGKEGLCHAIALRPFLGRRRIAIIDDADCLNEESANALLKTLEEPPPGSLIILVGTSADRQLPTIRSRAQIVRFRPLAADVLARLLLTTGVAADEPAARRLALASEGSLARAVDLADAELAAFRTELWRQLARDPLPSFELAQAVLGVVDAAGKDANPRRRRLRSILGFASELFRQLLRQSACLPVQGDDELSKAARAARGVWRDDAELLANCIDRCLEALEHVDRNANQTTLVECWLDDLAGLAARVPVGA